MRLLLIPILLITPLLCEAGSESSGKVGCGNDEEVDSESIDEVGYESFEEAMEMMDSPNARRYLLKNYTEFESKLKEIVVSEGENWYHAVNILIKKREPNLVEFFEKILRERYIENVHENSNDRYGNALIFCLSITGGEDAIPLLVKLKERNYTHLEYSLYQSLLRLGHYSIKDLFTLKDDWYDEKLEHLRLPGLILISITNEYNRKNQNESDLAIVRYNRFIKEFPDEHFRIESARLDKAMCYIRLQMFDKARAECGKVEASNQFQNFKRRLEYIKSEIDEAESKFLSDSESSKSETD